MIFFGSVLLISLVSLGSLLTISIANPISSRDSPNNRCGAQFGGNNCTSVGLNARCCSQYSYCGDTDAYCGSGCQWGYGNCILLPASEGNNPRATISTTVTPAPTITNRSRQGNVPYGVEISSCSTRGEIALTFDDGPWL